MATKNFRSTVLEPTSEFAHGDKLRFTALATVSEVLKGSFSETTIGEDGVYSVDLQYGKHRIDYKPYEGVWRHFADVEVNADTLATTLQDLSLASVPVTDETILVLQGILADAESAKTESAAMRDEAAASAAAAEEDAAKLADVTPESISAVSNATYKTIFKPDGGFLLLDGKSHLRIETPKFLGSSYTIMLRFSSWSEVAGDLLLSFMPYLSVNEYRGVSAVKMGGVDFDVDFCIDNANSKTFIVISRTDGGIFKETDVIMLTATSAVDINSANGWIMTSHDANPASSDQIITSLTTNNVTSDTVRSMTYNGVTSKNIRRINAKDAGIPDEIFDAALAEQQASDLFDSEKSIALQIFADFNLGTGEQEITGSDISDVRAYIQSIDPSKGLKAGHLQRAKIPRPSVFDRYKKNPYEL